MKSPIADEQRLEHIWHCLARIQEVVKTTSRDKVSIARKRGTEKHLVIGIGKVRS